MYEPQIKIYRKGFHVNKEKDDYSDFVREVAKYFMNFLETDFKKRRIPKRNTNKRIQTGLTIGFDLEKYSKLKSSFFASLRSGFSKSTLSIKKGDFTANIPDRLFKLIGSKIDDISDQNFNNIFEQIEEVVEELYVKYSKEYDIFCEQSIDRTKSILATQLINSFLDELYKPLQNLGLADDNSLFQLEIEIIDAVFEVFADKYVDILQVVYTNKDFDLQNKLSAIINLDEIKNTLNKFFKSFSTADAFFDISHLFRNNKLIDKTEVYLYFFEITVEKEKFPVFYTPIEITEENDKLILSFEKRLFVNTKAIDFVVQEVNKQSGGRSTLSGKFDRILYVNGEENFQATLQEYISTLETFFELKGNIDLKDSSLQKNTSIFNSLSNKSYLYIFDKSDESLINDYEEILSGDKPEVLGNFTSLIKSFIKDEPKPFYDEIRSEWKSRSYPEKLIFESPIPLNEEQKQVLMALHKPDCNFMLLEGPPGTGKSHTITSIICNALLEDKSVLVLSDKKEALDVVEDKISSTLNKIRHDNDFQNPILRLGKAGNKFNKIISGPTLIKIKDHYYAYKDTQTNLDSEKQLCIDKLEKNIQQNITYFQGIDIADIQMFFQNIERFSSFNWFQSEREYSIDLLKIKTVIKELTSINCDFPIHSDILNTNNFNLLKEYKKSIDILKQSKIHFDNQNVNTDLVIKEFSTKDPYKTNIISSLNSIKEMLGKLNSFMYYQNVFLDMDDCKSTPDIKALMQYSEIIQIFLHSLSESEKMLGTGSEIYRILSNLEIPEVIAPNAAIDEFGRYITALEQIKHPFFGYLFKRTKIEEVTQKFKETFRYFRITSPHKYIAELKQIYRVFRTIYQYFKDTYKSKNIKVESLSLVFKVVIDLLSHKNNKNHNELKQVSSILRQIINENTLIENSISSTINLNDLDYEISMVNWNIEIFKQVDNINRILKIISQYIPIDILTTKQNCEGYFKNEFFKTLDQYTNDIGKLINIKEDIDYVLGVKLQYSGFADRISLKISKEAINNSSSILSKYKDKEIREYLEFLKIQSKLRKQFNEEPKNLFPDSINAIEKMTTLKMTYFLDKSITEYTQKYPGQVKTLKSILKKKKRFPKELFQGLQKAFPCILAGIRDYAEFIPLEKNLFDLIIIDEASQVSIAQALPALIRGKQIIVLGDEKQFPNVKSSNASKEINQELKRRVQDCFKTTISDKEDVKGWNSKVEENFDIKNSILNFLGFIKNYDCQLKKHFRCYPEIISYSDNFFYNKSLQYMKIRGKSIEDVIKFEVIKHDGKSDIYKNTNELEAKYIIEKLKEFKVNCIEQSIGIISPHREQVTLLFDMISELPEREWLFNTCHLKIMTFDTCQGEEKDYVFYSMVATLEKDRLKWIFANSLDLDNNSIRMARLNVGFSRAKECIHFVLSKPISDFSGEIQHALLHYETELNTAKERTTKKLDSVMEYKVNEIFYQTKFYKENKENIEFIPQFELGKYLKQIDRNYTHPKYRVDFLLMFKDLKIVIEYDGFKEHFSNREEVNKSNYQYYLNDEDVYRQKVLEGYNYKFLRINRFNIGVDPVQTLDIRLNELIKKKNNGTVLKDFHHRIDRLYRGKKRSCDECRRTRDSICFPYKSVPYCIDCYEKKHNIVLKRYRHEHKIPQGLSNIKPNRPEQTKRYAHFIKCPACNSSKYISKGFRNNRHRYTCKECGRHWSVIIKDNKKQAEQLSLFN
jgi:superfamily I DNA and/or RNA helicase